MDASSSSFDTATATATVESAAAAVLATERWIVEKKKNHDDEFLIQVLVPGAIFNSAFY